MISYEEILDEISAQRMETDYDPVSIDRIISALRSIRSLFYTDHWPSDHTPVELIQSVMVIFEKEIGKVSSGNHRETIEEFLYELPSIQELLNKDIQAIYDGDPSVHTKDEIILSFPGFLAIFCHRIAHELYKLNVPVIPRIISEYAHKNTGIDIHPGAQIGEYFCIDHGTGVVIGETATIGDHVRIYHGVTLGVKKFIEDSEGKLIKGGKRHPDIGNHVVIYSNASVLGGDTVIGDHIVIKANKMISDSLATERDNLYLKGTE